MTNGVCGSRGRLANAAKPAKASSSVASCARQNEPMSPGGNAVMRFANGASRAGKFREIDVVRALRAAQKAKLQVGVIRIEPDGTILLIPGTPEAVPSSIRIEPDGTILVIPGTAREELGSRERAALDAADVL